MMPKPTHKPRNIAPECPKCGTHCAVVWMKDGSIVRAEESKVEVIFCNYANASGHYQNCYVKHQCKKGK